MKLSILAINMFMAQAVASPSRSDKADYARWMVSAYNWGVLSTISSMEGIEGQPFGNPNSFAEIDGIPYFYVSELDQSMQDVASNSLVSFTLSNAESLTSPMCGTVPYAGDPESPLCSRLVINGNFLNISGTSEGDAAKDVLFSEHKAMNLWPASHDWFVGKIEIEQLWEISMYGGASHITADEYYNATSFV